MANRLRNHFQINEAAKRITCFMLRNLYFSEPCKLYDNTNTNINCLKTKMYWSWEQSALNQFQQFHPIKGNEKY